jgi:hypothetical protein
MLVSMVAHIPNTSGGSRPRSVASSPQGCFGLVNWPRKRGAALLALRSEKQIWEIVEGSASPLSDLNNYIAF